MANIVGSGISRLIIDSDGDSATVTNNRLDVNAYLSSTPTIDIGDVSLLLGGSAASVNNGAADATTLRVTIASDTTGVLSIDDGGGSLTVDGTVSVNSHHVTNAGTFAVQSTLQEGSAAIGKLAANDGVDIGDVDVTSTVQPSGNGTFTSYAAFDAPTSVGELADSGSIGNQTDCKEIILQADSGNSGFIMVGSSGTSATGTLKGVKLSAGDTFILPVSNTESVFIDASASSQSLLVSIVK